MTPVAAEPGALRLCKYCGLEERETDFEVCKVVAGKVYRRRKCSGCKAERARERRREVRGWLEGLKRTLVCSRCGFCDFRALEFHHPDRAGKELNIGDMVTAR